MNALSVTVSGLEEAQLHTVLKGPLVEHTEFLAKAVQEWIAAVGAKTAYITPGSP